MIIRPLILALVISRTAAQKALRSSFGAEATHDAARKLNETAVSTHQVFPVSIKALPHYQLTCSLSQSFYSLCFVAG